MNTLTIDTVHNLYSVILAANRNPILCTVKVQNILDGNEVAKNIYVAIYGDGMIQSGGFEHYFYEIGFGKLNHAKIKKAFKAIGFTNGLKILNQAKSAPDSGLEALDMEYYNLSPSFEEVLVAYLASQWEDKEFVEYRQSINFKE